MIKINEILAVHNFDPTLTLTCLRMILTNHHGNNCGFPTNQNTGGKKIQHSTTSLNTSRRDFFK